MVNRMAEDYRHRIDWIENRLLEMADADGKVFRGDFDRLVYLHYKCSRSALQRYLETLEGAGILTQNSTHLIIEAKRPK